MEYKRARKVMKYLFFIGLAILILGLLVFSVSTIDAIILSALGTFTAAAALIIGLKYARCPICDKVLIIGRINDSHCPKCSEKI